ncbi:MAG TPA: bifunctional folylpolyglutamate synthase/dihydrofolate synthase [Gammaproteobacteria bacterium]|nr:bifunctional folylpolyglutamate synthase/dihydrofolate synthase [Gammaproteobacteria bacterium]
MIGKQIATVETWVEHIQSLHPQEMEFDLSRPRKVLDRLKLTDKLPFLITVAGTNGKGSCVELLTQVFQYADISVGSYTSPHLVRFNERIRVNGVEVSDEALLLAFDCVERARGSEPLTFFEFTSLAAFVVFVDADLDVLVLEAGLGGRLDVMNLLNADVLLLTNIALDHTKLLGNTREKIGGEKAGLMRTDQLVICGDRDVPRSVLERAEIVCARMLLLGRDFDYVEKNDRFLLTNATGEYRGSYTTPFTGGAEQLTNATCVATLLNVQQRFHVSDHVFEKAFSHATILGRKQVYSESPQIILDVAHNEDSVRSLANFIQTLKVTGTVYAIFGMLADKSVSPALEHIVKYVDKWMIAELDSPRAFAAGGLTECLDRATKAQNASADVIGEGNGRELWSELTKYLKDDDLLIVFGSFLLVGDILAYQSVTEQTPF